MPACTRRRLCVISIAFVGIHDAGRRFGIRQARQPSASTRAVPEDASRSIQDAVDATGKSGSVVNVAFGAYFDNVIIPKIKLTINADPDTAIIGITTDPIFTIAAGAKVTINNLQFQDTFTSSSCIESHGSLTMHNIEVFLCSGMRGAAIHQIGGQSYHY